MDTIYSSYLELAISLNPETRLASFYREGRGRIGDGMSMTFVRADGSSFSAADYAGVECVRAYPACDNGVCCTMRFTGAAEGLPEKLEVAFRILRDRVEVFALNLPEDITPVFEGNLYWGKVDDCFAVCLARDAGETDLRSALGPAVSPIDDALFDRAADEALTVGGSISRELGFSWENNSYTFKVSGMLTIGYLAQVYAQKFRVRYNPINKNNTFPKPPAGWMTWYAVRFDAGEKAVLENAAKQQEYLAAYGADTIWVDWEWYHSNLKGLHVSDDIGFMNPDPVRYPNGLKHVSDEIRRLGFIPALWIGPTCEPDETVMVKKYEDTVFIVKPTWCGRYFFDVTDERVRDELIPEAIEKVKEWGYDALKWDCLPITLSYLDQNHHKLKHPEMTSEEALRKVCEKAREVLGKDFYMLSCSGNDRVIMMAAETFDGARIGGDIFTWAEFISAFVERILRFYPFHNTLLYCDPDNVVIREEYNTMDQAKSRVSMVSLLGLPTTLGDDLRELPMDRVDLLRRALPTLNAHPKDIREGMHDGKRFLVNLAINRPFEAWNTAAVLNLLETEAETTVSLENDLKLAAGEYLVYDYWNDRFIGAVSDSLTLQLPPMGVAVLAIRKKLAHPQVLSTSRHITQGAVDLLDTKWDEESRTLTIRAEVVKDDPYKIRIHVPAGYTPAEGCVENGVLTVSPDTSESGEITVYVKF